ncbi:MAG TPA: hypothetical protein VF668_24665, partial [Pyrinomonadaceae bacterium]
CANQKAARQKTDGQTLSDGACDSHVHSIYRVAGGLEADGREQDFYTMTGAEKIPRVALDNQSLELSTRLRRVQRGLE